MNREGGLAPDVILPDLNMPGPDGLSATEILRGRHPGITILILSLHDAPGYVATAVHDRPHARPA